MRVLPRALLHTPAIANKTECLVTNGTGSFASLSVNGGLSRKFHGLLIHSVIPPMDRMLTWHACVETLENMSLDARQWLDGTTVTGDGGEQYLLHYTSAPVPTWHYEVNGHLLKKELFMELGKETTLIKYSLIRSPKPEVTLELSNFVHFRPAGDHLPRFSEQDLTNWTTDSQRQCVSTGQLSLKLGVQVTSNPQAMSTQWLTPDVANQICDLIYPIELEDQGYPQRDCSLKVHTTRVVLSPGDSCYMIGTLHDHWPNAEQAYQQVLAAKQTRFSHNDFANDLAHSALQLVADRESVNGKTILAGFPWFGDWGRDTMIALPGATLATGQFELAKSILKTFAHYLNGGMLPNKFPDRSGEPLKYNTIDATLWFFWAIQQYVEYSGDWGFVQRELYDDLKEVIRHHTIGTRYGIGMDDDGLIQGGDKDTQLTWMDVKFDNFAVTPRFGKAVEINALWYNALCFAQQCKERFEDHQCDYADLIVSVRVSFQSTFWNEAGDYCFDYVTPTEKNDDIRCNQIIAVSLPFSPLTPAQQQRVFNVVYQQLYTPVGLRSLSPTHASYKGRYFGPLHERDIAYHQGTVWAWPMGPFIDALMTVTKDKHFAEQLLMGLKQHFYYEAGILGVSEIFDGDAPNTARGCFNQAWSVAELLRVVDKYQLQVPG